MNKLSIEQKIVRYLADNKILTRPYDISEALNDQSYAEQLITGNGLEDEIKEQYGEDIGGDCDHESLTNEEIQVVFDNDEN